MKYITYLYILSFTAFLPAKEMQAQTFSRLTTGELEAQAKSAGSLTGQQKEINYALPLIDSTVAMELARLDVLNGGDAFTNAITLQCKDSVLKQKLLNKLIAHDQLCNTVLIEKNEYDQHSAGSYEYWDLTNLLLAQTAKDDTVLLKTAIKEFEFWAPFCSDFINTMMKSGMHQLTIGKSKFDPCMLGSFGNTRLWASCIYLITGKDEYGSANEELNKVYGKVMGAAGRGKKWTDNRKEFVSTGKTQMIALTAAINSTLDSLDFETIPLIKNKLDDTRKKDSWYINIYTHKNKALLFLRDSEWGQIGFRKELISQSSLYLLELTSPSTIQLSKLMSGIGIISCRNRCQRFMSLLTISFRFMLIYGLQTSNKIVQAGRPATIVIVPTNATVFFLNSPVITHNYFYHEK